MTEERTTTTKTPDGNTHTETVIRTDESGSGSKGWVFLVVLLIAVIAGIYFLSQMGGAEMAKDGAIADAAEQVGNAAEQAGDAVEEVADTVTNNE
ncbi:hypothetical protein QWY75_04985 [Pontixanthobacter aestiaquae]|uniref:Uncharacterized protein n=1 Tax=Pontixanthobacter aestiaquae TaxID=1509367 RepID=A0A844Z9B7_9SPHN|nr:hypothetical protein [Pontixanthobacter aestiaquae]MDN3645562.1 hypothetical protein [Pontixanthobacter aestiaquae]MXO83440.1 hypothetical protein [Pontixanthobacter aestiaquae]